MPGGPAFGGKPIIGGGGGWIGSAVFLTKRDLTTGSGRLGVRRRQHHFGVGVQDIESARGILFRRVRSGGVVFAAFGPRDRDIAAIDLDDVAAAGTPVLFGTLGVGKRSFPPADIDVLGGGDVLGSSGRSASGDDGSDARRAFVSCTIGGRRHRLEPLSLVNGRRNIRPHCQFVQL